MTDTSAIIRRIGRGVADVLLGLVGTLAVALVLLNVTTGLQRPVYDALYLRLGPSGATEAAILLQFLVSGLAAVLVPLVVADYVHTGLANRDALVAVLLVFLGVPVAFTAVALAGFPSTPIALLLLVLVLLGAPVLLWLRFDVRSGALPTFVGSVPAVVLLMLLAAVGIGWGWGYVVTAQEVPASPVDDATVGSLSDRPVVASALFSSGNCETDAEGFRECHLSLRGFEHERDAVRALSELGVRCPYQRNGGDGGTAIVQHEGRYYRVGCSPHGD
ncbi:hypothetical protein [Haloarchaeobius iranensis]|uniref:Uncharacterized protein n=1 Tax=Haloarchaeobius iranensis TaxID=996166 RepID=A0A1G9YMU1_9EURY|nr:hypothetical protein [Haloarchaeobius iranensis]SDN09726.1 hypothetical protein SAMN05192554_11517 [Haloarchaeobius iranensis]